MAPAAQRRNRARDDPAVNEGVLSLTRTGCHFVSLPRSCHKIKAVTRAPPAHATRTQTEAAQQTNTVIIATPEREHDDLAELRGGGGRRGRGRGGAEAGSALPVVALAQPVCRQSGTALPRPSHAAVRASPACDGEGGARARGPARVWPRARRRERAVVRRPESPAGKRRHDCVGPKSLRRPYGVSAGQRPALRCALRPGADRRSACGAALRASPPLPARQRAGGMQSRWEVTARSKGAAGARRKTDGKWPPRTASGGPPADGCSVALPATGPVSVCAAGWPRSNAHLPRRGGHETG